MASTDSMRSLIQACVDVDPAKLKTIVRQRLRESPLFRSHLLASRGQRRLAVGDVQAAQQWQKLAAAIDPHAGPALELGRRLAAHGGSASHDFTARLTVA